MDEPVPSPIGHALAGAAIAWAAPRAAARGASGLDVRLTVLAVACATLPDLDLVAHLIPPYNYVHRTATHSVTAVLLVTIIATAVTGWVNRGNRAAAALRPVLLGLVCGAAWGSHLVLDWLGTDTHIPRGIQLAWPWSDQWFVSGWDLFPPTERRDPLSMATMLKNAKAAVTELMVMGSIAAAVWYRRSARRNAPHYF